MVIRVKEKGKASRWEVVGLETAIFAEEPPPPKGKRTSFN